MLYLKESTSATVLIGPFVLASDGDTEYTTALSNTDILLSKNGGTLAAKNSGGSTHDDHGMHTITLNGTDTNTVGTLQLACHVSTTLAVYHEFQVIETNIYDALFASGAAAFDANARVDVASVAGTAQTAGDIMGSLGEENAAAAAGDPSTTVRS